MSLPLTERHFVYNCSSREPPELPSAAEAMAFVERVLDKALTAAEADLQRQGGTLAFQTACDARDAAMLAMCVGHVGLTVRISVIRTLKATAFKDDPCTCEKCTLAHCTGNRLELLEDAAYKLVVPHHKTSGRGIAFPAVPIASKKLNHLLRLWQGFGRRRVSELCGAQQWPRH